MFYCEKCRVERGWPESFGKSHGPCEICHTVAVCNDIPSRALPEPKRKPESTIPDKEQRERHERYMSYMRGWFDGAGRHAIRKELEDHPRDDLVSEYHRGYTEGQEAGRRASAKAARRLRYKPTILRLAKHEAPQG